jgi:imidazolonepropionase-like amidohydrolase
VIRSRAAALALAAAVAAAPSFAGDLLIENATVVSREQALSIPRRYVLIHDDRIANISELPIKVTDDVVRINGAGKFLVPGIMDSHVHVSEPPGIRYSEDNALRQLTLAYAKQQPRSYLYFGVTQLLDPSNLPDAIAVFNAQPLHPDLFRCGAAPVLNGYPTVFVPPPLRYKAMPDYIFEPANHDALPPDAIAAHHTPEAVVSRIAQSGAKCVKVFIEDGFGPASDWPLLSAATLKRVVQLAHERGMIVMAHANDLDMQRMAVAARVDVMAHGLWHWGNFNDKAGIPEPIADHLRQVHQLKIGWQPTFRVLEGLRELFLPNTLNDPVYAAVVPPALLAWYHTDPGQWYKREERGPNTTDAADPIVAKSFDAPVDRGMRATRYIYELGHPLLLASDTPSAPTYGNQPGYDTFREMQLMARAGMKPPDIFDAATLNPARQFHIDKDYGTIARGKIANLLLLDADPLQSVDAWNRIDKIILHGAVLERAALAANYNKDVKH